MPDHIETIAAVRLEELLIARGGKMFTGNLGSRAYLMPNGQTVRMPEGNARIPEVVVSEIAKIKLDMHDWEYDYWLSEQDDPGFSVFKIPPATAGQASMPVQHAEERAQKVVSMIFPGSEVPKA